MLPPELRRFILTSIPSIPYLEALLLLHSEPEMPWTSESLAKRLYISSQKSEELLSQLTHAGVAKSAAESNEFFYAPEFAEQRQIIEELSKLYSKNLLEITHLIHSKIDRSAQRFADAFKLRGDT